jgi:predicted transcriptional regulator
MAERLYYLIYWVNHLVKTNQKFILLEIEMEDMEYSIFKIPLVDTLFAVMKEENRRSILLMLRNQPMTADRIAEILKITRPAIEKHLKPMLETGLIERRAETIPNLHFIYHIPELTKNLLGNLEDFLKLYIDALKEEYTNRCQNIEQTYLAGMTTKDQYETMKNKHQNLLSQLRIE